MASINLLETEYKYVFGWYGTCENKTSFDLDTIKQHLMGVYQVNSQQTSWKVYNPDAPAWMNQDFTTLESGYIYLFIFKKGPSQPAIVIDGLVVTSWEETQKSENKVVSDCSSVGDSGCCDDVNELRSLLNKVLELLPKVGEGCSPKTPTPTDIIIPSQTPTPTPTLTSSPTTTSSQTPTPLAQQTPTPTETPTSSPSATSTQTQTPLAQQTPTPTETPTSSPSATSTQTPTPLAQQTPTPTETPTSSPSATSTQTPTPLAQQTPTPTETPTSSPSSSPTSSPSGAKEDETPTSTDDINCANDVKTCFDGSVVTRDPDNNCAFADCPEPPPEPFDDDPCVDDTKRCADGSFVGRDPGQWLFIFTLS